MASAGAAAAVTANHEQFNLITGRWECEPVQLTLDLGVSPPGAITEPVEEGATLLTTEGGSQLFVSGFGLSLGKKSERVTIRKRGKICGELPLFRVQEIVLAGQGMSISTDLIDEACRRGIRIAFLTPGARPVALLTSPFLTATVATRREQMLASMDHRGAEFVRKFVAGKLQNQEKLLRYFGKSREGAVKEAIDGAAGTLRALRERALSLPGNSPEEIREEAMGLEGAGARAYWRVVGALLGAESGFAGRVHENPHDPVNAALNYGYGILYSHVWGAVMNAGLEPFSGFLHTERPGKPSLVLDLTEEFRQPVVDRPILAWLFKGGALKLEDGLLDRGSREEVASRALARLMAEEDYRGRTHQVRSIIQMQARLVASAVRGAREYKPFSFRW